MSFDYSRYFREITLTHDLITRPEQRTWQLGPPPRDAERHAIVLYLGCNVLRTSHLVQTVAGVFDRLGLDYVAVGGPAYCCGIVHHREGDTAAGASMGNRTIDLFMRYRPDEVVMWCPSCIYFYDEVRQTSWPFRVRHTAEFLADRLPEIAFTRRVEAVVALHGHEQFEPRRREADAGRKLLAGVPGVTLVPFEADARFGRSCAPAIPDQLGHEVWTQMCLDDIDRALAAGATTLAGIYHGCHRMLCGFEGPTRPITIEHYLTVFARGLGIEHEDTFKKYRQWADPERVLADMTPCQQANGVDPARAREIVLRTFPGPGSLPAGGRATPS